MDGKLSFLVDYLFRKSIKSGYYMVYYLESADIYSTGLILDGRMEGIWLFYKRRGTLYASKEYYRGRLLGKHKMVSLSG